VAELSEPHQFYLAQFMGIRGMNIHVETRCTRPRGALLPIAVQEPWYIESFNQGTPFPILGEGADAYDQPGNDFPGAVYTHVWCEDGPPCEEKVYWDPIPHDTTTESCQPHKATWRDSIMNEIPTIYVPINKHIPHLAGVSNNQVVQATQDAGWKEGDTIYVMIFDGKVYRASHASCDNLRILYYAEAVITAFDNNTMEAVIVGEPIYELPELISKVTSRTIPLHWAGPTE
jgi:hypothetical protein